MAVASLFGGLALANAGLGAVHGFAGPIGGMFHAPHGAVCAALLPRVMDANIGALEQRQPESAALRRYGEIARLLTGDVKAEAADAVEWVGELISDLGIPKLGTYGITTSQFSDIVEKAEHASSMKANPIVLIKPELQRILEKSL
jgi:alcohol dehydrogenase class IV